MTLKKFNSTLILEFLYETASSLGSFIKEGLEYSENFLYNTSTHREAW